MNRVKLHDKTFELSIPEEEILKSVKAVAGKVNKDYEGRHPVILAVLNGSFMFCADFVRELTIPCEVNFVKLSSYSGTQSTGKVEELIGVNSDISGRDIIIVEDIVESGNTLLKMKNILDSKNVASARICSLFFKPAKLQADINVDYPAMIIPDDFIVGYGLDYDGEGRQLKDVYTLCKD